MMKMKTNDIFGSAEMETLKSPPHRYRSLFRFPTSCAKPYHEASDQRKKSASDYLKWVIPPTLSHLLQFTTVFPISRKCKMFFFF